jgi:hypothetical protein
VNEQGSIGAEASNGLREKIDDVSNIEEIRLGDLFVKKQWL